METDPTAVPDPATGPATMKVAEPVGPTEPAPLGFERIKEMVEKGVQLVEQGIQAGTVEFHKAEGLDWHGFKAWRAAHADETVAGELDAVEAKAVVDTDVETEEAKELREQRERAEETPEAKADREAWEAETGKSTHFSTPPSVDPTPADPGPTAATAAPASATASVEPVALDLATGEPIAQ